MDHSAISFDLDKDETGFLKGFSLTAVETYAECFCVTFPYAQVKQKAWIEFSNDGKIHFVHNGIGPEETNASLGVYAGSEGGTYEADIAPDDAAALQDFLAKRGRYEGATIKFRLERAFGKGFSLRAELPGVA